MSIKRQAWVVVVDAGTADQYLDDDFVSFEKAQSRAAQVIPLLQIAGRDAETGSNPGNGIAGTHLIASAGQRRIIRELRRLYGGNVARGQRFTQLGCVFLRHHDVLWPASAQR